MKPKIAFIGAGSTVFASNLIGDILSLPGLDGVTLSLHDINTGRLASTSALAKHIASHCDAQPSIQTTTDRRTALRGADYVIDIIQVGGYQPATVVDFEIPKKYGLRQTIADTLGIGGIMRGLRTIPVLLEIVRDMEELCPDALHLNYVNPLAINTWALNQASPIPTIGLCHSVVNTARDLARDLNLPPDEIRYQAAGINHLSFFLTLEYRGENLYPRLQRILKEGQVPDSNLVRYEMLSRLGYFVTESSEHFSEYVPWFIKGDRPDLIERFNIPLDEYLYRCQAQIKAWKVVQRNMDNLESITKEQLQVALEDIPLMPEMKNHLIEKYSQLDRVTLSSEYAPQIIQSLETGRDYSFYGNLPNAGWIDNLPEDACVEVPCQVSGEEIQPVRVGEMPSHLAALIQTNINVQRLTVKAALERDRDAIYHAAMLDPHTSAELDLDQIWNLVDDLLEAHGGYLPEYG